MKPLKTIYKMGILISVVIPVYNKRKSIRNTLTTVLNQIYSDFEVIVLDDGSTDGSLEEISDFNDSRLRVISKENTGVSDTRNLGIREAKGSVVAFLDGDDLWDPYYLDRLHAMIVKYPDCGLYMQNSVDIFASEAGKVQGDSVRKEIQCFNNWEHYFYYRNFKTSALAVNRSLALKLGGFDKSLTIGEDLDFWFRTLLSAPVCFLDEIHVFILKYEAGYHSRLVPLDYTKHFSYKLITHPELYLSLKDNIDVRKVMNKVIFFAWLCFTKDKNEAAVRLLSKHIRFSLLNYKDKIKYILYHLGLLDSYLKKL